MEWLCKSCSHDLSRECWNRTKNERCFLCSRGRPREPVLYKSRYGVHAAGGAAATGLSFTRRTIRTPAGAGSSRTGTGQSGKKDTAKKDAATSESEALTKSGRLRQRYEQVVSFEGKESTLAKHVHQQWKSAQEEEKPHIGGAAVKKIKKLQEKLELYKGIAEDDPDTPGIGEAIREAEEELKEAEAEGGGKAATEKLRQLEGKRQDHVNELKACETNMQGLLRAKESILEEIEGQESHNSSLRELIGDYDVKIAAARRALAGAGTHLGEEQTELVQTSFGEMQKRVEESLLRLEAMGGGTLPTQAKDVMQDLLDAVGRYARTMPPELRPKTDDSPAETPPFPEGSEDENRDPKHRRGNDGAKAKAEAPAKKAGAPPSKGGIFGAPAPPPPAKAKEAGGRTLDSGTTKSDATMSGGQ